MKKFAFLTLIGSIALFSVTYSQAESQQAVATTSSATNKADIQADIAKIEAFSIKQEAKTSDLEQQIEEAMAEKDQAAIKKLVGEFKTIVAQSNTELSTLPLKTDEAKQLRDKMVESSVIGLEMSDIMFTGADESEKAKLPALQGKVLNLQQEIMQMNQSIQATIQGQ